MSEKIQKKGSGNKLKAVLGLVSGFVIAYLGTESLMAAGPDAYKAAVTGLAIVAVSIALYAVLSGIVAGTKALPMISSAVTNLFFNLTFVVGFSSIYLMYGSTTKYTIVEILANMVIDAFFLAIAFSIIGFCGFAVGFFLVWCIKKLIHALSPSKPTI